MADALTSFKAVTNLGFNPEKTEMLVAGLKEDGVVVGIEDLSSYLRKQGIIVEEHIGRRRNYINVSPKLFGVDLATKGTEVNEFFHQHMQAGKIGFIPEDYDVKLRNIEATVRRRRERTAIGYDAKFMTLAAYSSFMELVKQKKQEYFEVRDDIIAKWDILMERFKELLWDTLNELDAIDKETVFDAIMSRLPSKKEYGESFYMSISAKAFPVTENLDMFSDEIQSQIQDGLTEETISTLYEVVGNTLNDAFNAVCMVITAIDKSHKLASTTITAVKSAAKRIAGKNIFNNPKIDEIHRSIESLISSTADKDIVAEEAEIIAAKIYGYAHELDIGHLINLKVSPLSEEELLEEFTMVSGVALAFPDMTGRTPLKKMLA